MFLWLGLLAILIGGGYLGWRFLARANWSDIRRDLGEPY